MMGPSLNDVSYCSEGRIETATLGQDGKSTIYIGQNIRLELSQDSQVLRTSIQSKTASACDITSTMACIMQHILTDKEALDHELGLFFGPVEVNGRFHGHIIGLIIWHKENGRLEPVCLCVCWNSKVAMSKANMRLLGINTSEELPPPHFVMQTDSHDIQATLDTEGNLLKLLVRSLYHDPSSIQSWSLISIPLAETPRDTLQRINTGTILPQDQTITVTNNWTRDGHDRPGMEILSCTITKFKTGDDVNNFLTHAGLGLAVVGLYAGLPAFPASLGMAVAIGGVNLAVKPYVDTLWEKIVDSRGSATEITQILYPGDKMQLYYFGQVPQTFKVDLVRRTATIVGKKTFLQTIRYTAIRSTSDGSKDAQYRNLKFDTSAMMTRVVSDAYSLSAINIDAPLTIIERRLLFVEGLKTVADDFVEPHPLGWQEAAILDYSDKEKLDFGDIHKLYAGKYHTADYWSRWWNAAREGGTDKMFQSDPKQKLAIVQSEIRPGIYAEIFDRYAVGAFVAEVMYFTTRPFMPVLCLKDTRITIAAGEEGQRESLGAVGAIQAILAAIKDYESGKGYDNTNLWGY